MVGFNPYITFEGTCEEALHFYKSCFGGEILFIQYYRESPQAAVDKQFHDKIMHSEFKAGPVHFMACDVSGGESVLSGNPISFNIMFVDPQQQKRVFQKLAAGGTIKVPLEKTFWQSIFGMVTDRYGLHWMLNCEISSSPTI
jgi:PhnB protein